MVSTFTVLSSDERNSVPLKATSYVSFLFPIIFNILTGMEVCAVNAGSLGLFNIPCKLHPFIEDWNTTSLCNVMLLGRFAKLRKVTALWCLAVRPSISPHETAWLPLDGFSWNLIFEYFFKYVRKSHVLLKSDTNNGYFTWRPVYIFDQLLAQFFLEWEIIQTNIVDKIKTHVLCSVTFWKSCHLWDNVEKYCIADKDTDDNMVHVHCTLDTYGYKHTVRICNTHCFSTATMVTRKRLNIALYVHCLSCIIYV